MATERMTTPTSNYSRQISMQLTVPAPFLPCWHNCPNPPRSRPHASESRSYRLRFDLASDAAQESLLVHTFLYRRTIDEPRWNLLNCDGVPLGMRDRSFGDRRVA